MLTAVGMMPQAYWDSFVMERFPGKTLEELDAIDWGRLMRVLHVRQIEQIENVREAYLKGKGKPTSLEWEAVLRHDRLIGDD